jgi:hypothetical protein
MSKRNVISRYDKTDRLSTITLKRRNTKGADTGANVVLCIDGVVVKSATSFKYKVNARGVAQMTITLIGRLTTK